MPDRIIDATKLFVQYAWAVWVVTAVFLFVPPTWLASLGIGPAVSVIRPYVGASFIVATVLTLGRVGKVGWAKIAHGVVSRKRLAELHDRLHRLTAVEQDVLRPFIRNQTRTQALDWTDGVVVGLELAQVIYNAAPFKRVGFLCAFNMQEWAYTYLNKHPELVGLDIREPLSDRRIK